MEIKFIPDELVHLPQKPMINVMDLDQSEDHDQDQSNQLMYYKYPDNVCFIKAKGETEICKIVLSWLIQAFLRLNYNLASLGYI